MIDLSNLPQGYKTGAKVATRLTRAYPWLEREDVQQQAFLRVAETLARGKHVCKSFLSRDVYHDMVQGPVRRLERETRFEAGLRPVFEESMRANLKRGNAACVNPEHTERRNGNCVACKRARDRRAKEKKRAVQCAG